MVRKELINKILKIALFVFSIAVLFFLLRYIGFDKVGQAFVSVGVLGAIILILFGFLENGLDAFALSFAVSRKIPFLKVFSSNCIGALTNLIIPWEAGEVVKIGLLKKNVGAASAIKGIVLWNYIFKLSKAYALIVILVISYVAGHDYQIDHFFIVVLAAFLGFLPYFGMMIIIKSNISVKLVKLLKLLGKKNSEELIKKAEEMDNSLKKFKKERPRDYKVVFFSQFFARFASFFTFVACANFAGFHYSFSTLSLAYCAITLSGYIVSFIPVKIGVGEGVGFFIFTFLGLDGGAGLLITFILRIKAIIAMSIVSAFIAVK